MSIHKALGAQRLFLPLLALGALDRLLLLLVFGSKYAGDDDGVIWSAALDYGHGLFREPFFYGQDYAVMLEALIAAPFTRLGIPLHILMPVVTSLLALAPYWSFALWLRKHDRPFAALVFLAMPILLPVEFGMMTTMTRCFVPGIALLAFLPWIQDMQSAWRKHLLMGLVISTAAYVNPNSLVFSAAFVVWSLLGSEHRWRATLAMIVGCIPFAVIYFAAGAYCLAHPERMMNGIHDWRMSFHPEELIPESFGMLHLHFAWLFPLLPSAGILAFFSLLALTAWNFRTGQRQRALALSASLLLIVLSFAFPKTHDGTSNVFFAYSRMYLTMPLLLCWGIANAEFKAQRFAAIILLVACSVAVGVKYAQAPQVIHEQLASISAIVHELPVVQLEADANALQDACSRNHVGLVVCSDHWKSTVPCSFRCYMYPALNRGLPPTYLHGRERRFWQRDAFSLAVVPNVLFSGGDSAVWAACIRQDDRLQDVSDATCGQLHLLRNNTEMTDSLVARLLRMQEAH